jgi:hypothetical protein
MQKQEIWPFDAFEASGGAAYNLVKKAGVGFSRAKGMTFREHLSFMSRIYNAVTEMRYGRFSIALSRDERHEPNALIADRPSPLDSGVCDACG